MPGFLAEGAQIYFPRKHAFHCEIHAYLVQSWCWVGSSLPCTLLSTTTGPTSSYTSSFTVSCLLVVLSPGDSVSLLPMSLPLPPFKACIFCTITIGFHRCFMRYTCIIFTTTLGALWSSCHLLTCSICLSTFNLL